MPDCFFDCICLHKLLLVDFWFILFKVKVFIIKMQYRANSYSGFPADQETTDLIPAASANVWWVTVNDSTFTYNLKRAGTDREFTVSFDLTRPVDVQETSWGWE